MDNVVKDLVERLDLEPHPEGGYYRRTFESEQMIHGREGEQSLKTARRAGSAILYLLPSSEVSRFHRLGAHEIWFYHWGSPLTLHRLTEGGHETDKLGPSLENGEKPQVTVPAGEWFGATVEEGYTLVSCAVIPEFDFDDYELADADELKDDFPRHRDIINRLTDQ